MGCFGLNTNCREKKEECGCKTTINSFRCVRYDGHILPCINLKKGDTLEAAFENINSLLCNIKDGEDGLSAYEVAIKNGFEGTEEEWLESLKGEDGAPCDCPEPISCVGFDVEIGIEEGSTGFENRFYADISGGQAPYAVEWRLRHFHNLGSFEFFDTEALVDQPYYILSPISDDKVEVLNNTVESSPGTPAAGLYFDTYATIGGGRVGLLKVKVTDANGCIARDQELLVTIDMA